MISTQSLPLDRAIAFLITLLNVAVAVAMIALCGYGIRVALTFGPDRARAVVTTGLIHALSFWLAATILRSIQVESWNEIGVLFSIFGLRLFLKLAMKREQRRLRESFT